MMIVRLRAPAKLNLSLAVLGTRSDGYHALHSVMLPLALADDLAIALAASGAVSDDLAVSGEAVAGGPDNLVLRAIAATRAAVEEGRPRDQRGGGRPAAPWLSVRLHKRVPIAAGLAGGSSDAAAAIRGALEAWGAAVDPAVALAVAASVGSDVPFFLAGGAALVSGRGELVEPLPDLVGPALGVLLVTPRIAVSTADVFAAYEAAAGATAGAAAAAEAWSHPAAATQASLRSALAVSEDLVAALRSGLSTDGLLAMAADLAWANDLVRPAERVAPGLGGFRDALSALLGRPVGQSGSGPTAWALYRSPAGARSAAREVRAAIRAGRLPQLGSGEPFIAATTWAARAAAPEGNPGRR